MCTSADDLYNEKFVGVKGPLLHASKADEKGRSDAMFQGSYTMSFVSEGDCKENCDGVVGGPESCSKFSVSAQERNCYNVVCLLATSKHSKYVFVCSLFFEVIDWLIFFFLFLKLIFTSFFINVGLLLLILVDVIWNISLLVIQWL